MCIVFHVAKNDRKSRAGDKLRDSLLACLKHGLVLSYSYKESRFNLSVIKHYDFNETFSTS